MITQRHAEKNLNLSCISAPPLRTLCSLWLRLSNTAALSGLKWQMEKQTRKNPGSSGRLKRLLRGLHLPTRRAPQPAVQHVSRPTHPPSNTASRVLIVEMGGWSCGSLPQRLGQFGHETQVVRGRKAALEVLERQVPVLLIVGGAADLDLYHALRQASPAPILALAPQGNAGQAVVAFAAGVDQYQAGPISSSEAAMWARAMLRRAT
jgi:CheY-like chemotaxis protein